MRCLAGLPGQPPGGPQRPPRPTLQGLRRRHPDDVLDTGLVQEVQHLGVPEASVQSDSDPRLGKRRLELPEHPVEDRDQPRRGLRVARPKHRAQKVLLRLVVERHRPDQRQVAVGVVVAVEEAQLLLAVGRIVRGVEVERDEPTAPSETTPVALDYRIGQRVGHAVQVRRLHGVLEARQRRLRRQRLPVDRVPIDQQLVDRIVCEFPRIVGVRVTQRDREDPLLEQLLKGMVDLPRLPRVPQARSQPFRQPEAPIEAFEQHGTAVRAALLLLQLGYHRLASEVRKQNTLCGKIVTHEEAPVARKRV